MKEKLVEVTKRKPIMDRRGDPVMKVENKEREDGKAVVVAPLYQDSGTYTSLLALTLFVVTFLPF